MKSADISVSNSTVDVASLPKGNYVVTSELNGEKAVSYTHLDVYKRQI